jgi:hypothetical protein
MKKPFRISLNSVLIVFLLLSIAFTGVEMYKYVIQNSKPSVAKVAETLTNKEIKEAQNNDPKGNQYIQDALGDTLTNQLKQRGVNMGFINTANILRLKQQLPLELKSDSKADKNALVKHATLDFIKPIPENATQKNLLVWDEYNIKVPINYASFQELFQANENGLVDFDKMVNNDPIDSPVQTLLTKGIVHLPISPLPGEVGNSYIIGHSSNYSSVKSDYNFVFAPLVEKTKNDQVFHIFDYAGRDLTFKVIESVAVKEADVLEAYKNFGDRRVVTLQGSILETVNGKSLPTKRWLTRAELVQ